VHYVARGVFENVDEFLKMFIRFQESRSDFENVVEILRMSMSVGECR